MIRRLLVVVVLLGLSLLALHLTIGFENFATSGSEGDQQPIRESSDDAGPGAGVVVGGVPGDSGGAVSMSGRGRFEYTRSLPHEFPDGETRFLPRFTVVATDSETVADDLLRLDDVEAKIYRIEDGDTPQSVHVGTIRAREAFVQVGRDERGNPSIREDRDMDLYGVSLTSTGDSVIRGLALQVERLSVQQSDAGIRFQTPRGDEPFHVQLGGDRPASLNGLGLSGFTPSKDALDQPLELHVGSRPVLERLDLELRADGPLDYVEDVRTGFGHIETRDNVELTGFGVSGVSGTAVARGDSLSGTLLRAVRTAPDGVPTGRPDGPATWGRLLLRGSQARLSADPIELNCNELTVAPAVDGKPTVFTAIGSPSVVDQRTGTRFHAAERIHLIDIPGWLGALHRDAGYGTPQWPPIAGQLVVFEGASRIVETERGLTITASDGLRVLRSATADGPLIAVGDGEVHVERNDLAVSGDDGFELRQSAAGQSLRLGPEWPVATHRYRIERLDERARLVVTGSGSCQLDRDAAGTAHITLSSPGNDVVLTRGDDRLDGVRALTAILDPEGGMREIATNGTPCHVVVAPQPGRESIEGTAARVESPDGRSFVLHGSPEAPAEITRSGRDRVAGHRIHLRPAGERRLWLAATGDVRRASVRVHGAPGEADSSPYRVDLDADRIILAPTIVPPLALLAHGAPRLGHLVADHVLASGRVELVERDPDDDREVAMARGETFLLRVRGAEGALRGSPARIETPTPDGRRLIGRADDVRFAAAAGGSGELRLLPSERYRPELDVRGGGRGPLSNVRLDCEGAIEALPAGVRFGGPVHAQGLTADGAPDPEGLDVHARELEVGWSQETREIHTLVAKGEPSVRLSGITASGELVRIDVPSTTMDVRAGVERLATVGLDGSLLTGSMFRVDYTSRRVQAWAPDWRGDLARRAER